MFDEIKTGRRMPQWEATMFISGRTLIDPSLWSEDVYYREQTKYTGTREVGETVTAAYVMAREDAVPAGPAFAVATILAIASPASRMYLDRHWTSDVVAGWCLGISIAAGCAAIYESTAPAA